MQFKSFTGHKLGHGANGLKNGFKDIAAFAADDSADLGIVNTVISIVVLAIIMGLCAMIVANIQPFVKASPDNANASSAIANVFDTTWSALGLLPIVLIVLVAVVVIGSVYMLTPNRG